MQDLTGFFSIGISLYAVGFWLLFFIRTRKNPPSDTESRRRSALRALFLLLIAGGLMYCMQFIPRVDQWLFFSYPIPDMFIFVSGVAIWAGIGMIININVTDNNQAYTPFQKKANFFTAVLMISAIFWAIIPYFGFIFFPRIGFPLDISLALTGGILATLAVLDLLT